MNSEEQKAFEEKIYAFVGQDVCPPTRAPDDINMAMIRHWAEAIGDKNPAYTDPEWAANSSRGNTISPPAMMYSWNQQGYKTTTGRDPDGLSRLVQVFDDHGYFGSLGVNVKQEYFKEVSPGDHIVMEMIIDSVSEQKSTARGIGYFLETLGTFKDSNGDVVGTQRFRVLKFIPAADAAESQSSDDSGDTALELPTRIASPRGHDNSWWWEACDEGKVLIQRCKSCNTLRHPPRPFCGECQSNEWDSIESTLDGEIYSFVEMHHPKIPGYQYPLLVAVIDLAEGTRIVANVVGCEPEDVHIGMKLKGKVEKVDEKTSLPQFYPVTAA